MLRRGVNLLPVLGLSQKIKPGQSVMYGSVKIHRLSNSRDAYNFVYTCEACGFTQYFYWGLPLSQMGECVRGIAEAGCQRCATQSEVRAELEAVMVTIAGVEADIAEVFNTGPVDLASMVCGAPVGVLAPNPHDAGVLAERWGTRFCVCGTAWRADLPKVELPFDPEAYKEPGTERWCNRTTLDVCTAMKRLRRCLIQAGGKHVAPAASRGAEA